MRRVPRFVVAVTVVVVAALVATVLLLEFDSQALGRAALARIGPLLGGQVDARAFRFRLVRGLSLEGLTASSDLAGGRWTLTSDSLLLEHRLWPLLGGRMEIEKIALRRPHLRLEQGPSGGAAPARGAALPGAAALALRVVVARMDDGTVEVVTPGQPSLTISDLDFSMRDLGLAGTTLAGLTAAGDARAASIRFARTEATDVKAGFTVAGGALTAEAIRFRTRQGRFEAALKARLDRLPLTYSLDLRGDPLDLNAMAGLDASSGLGAARLQLTGQGSGSSAAGLRGQGRLRMEAGRLPASPVLQRVQGFLASPLVGARYQASETPFRLEGGRAHFDSFRLQAEALSLDMRGWIALEGPVELAVNVRAPRSAVRITGVSADVLDALADAEGYVVVPLTVTGTQSEPVVRPDMGTLMAAAGRGAGAVAARKAGEGIRGWLRGRRKQ